MRARLRPIKVFPDKLALRIPVFVGPTAESLLRIPLRAFLAPHREVGANRPFLLDWLRPWKSWKRTS